MKRVLLVFASVLIGLTTATATELNSQKSLIKLEKKKSNRYAQPIMFTERGIEFLIFPDGSFDFNTNINDGYFNDTYYRSNSRRSNVNRTQRGPNSSIKSSSKLYNNRGVSISHDRDGKVRRIGNVYVNYDRHGRITRTGSIFMSYNRGKHSNLSTVGGLQVNYNRWGEITNTRGQVNRYNRNYFGIAHDFENTRGNGHGNHQNNSDDNYQNNSDDNYYYYKHNGKVKKHKKNKR